MLWLLIGMALAGGPRQTLQSWTAERGLYDNRIEDTALAVGFTEVCFGDGAIATDAHPEGGVTAGGACVPGDLGFILKDEPHVGHYPEVLGHCASWRMRLIAPTELGVARLAGLSWATGLMAGLLGSDDGGTVHATEWYGAELHVATAALDDDRAGYCVR